jgi:hypothetical protein
MAQRSSSKLTKAPIRRPQQNRDEETPAQITARESLEAAGENGAPGDPSHLMPGSSGSYEQSIGEPRDDKGNIDDLSPERMAESGYPDPETTPEESQISTRNEGTATEQVEKRVDHAHRMLDEKLDSIRTQNETAIRVRSDEEGFSDFAELPNAPKGKDVLILGPDEPLRVSGEEDGGQIILDKTIYRAVRPFRTKRWSFTLVHPKGAAIPSSQIRKVQEPVPVPEETGTPETKDVKPSDETKNDENK